MTKLSLFLLLCMTQLLAREVTKGQVELIEFSKLPTKAIISMNGINYPIHTHPKDSNKKYILVPIAYKTSQSEQVLHISYPKGSKDIPLHVNQGEYKSETIQVASAKVHPNPKQKARTQREYKEAMKIYHTTRDKMLISKPFTLPINSSITSPFGTARMYNDTLKSFHSGVDFRAKMGTNIKASNDGIVVLAQKRYYAGNSIIIDHGKGIYSCYYHLSALHVKLGDTILQGDSVGLSGKSGRVTGPHLHYAFMVQGVQIDPLAFHKSFNQLFE